MLDDPDRIMRYLRGRGLRSTDARRKIVEVVLDTDDHFTAEDLLDRIKDRGYRVSRASVYRTLSLLCDGGFVESREFQRGQTMYELMVGQNHHDHLICTQCDRIVEFENDAIERLQEEVAAQHGFRLDHHSLRLFGTCPACL
jgi:Fur family ferric uptake transcriptional regulator